ncbi:hypothetical protein QJQ45_018250 [Haematococcus lacustris]|nr:hypothetical protein QJQ45_018250 [Haematococcus lacustris]
MLRHAFRHALIAGRGAAGATAYIRHCSNARRTVTPAVLGQRERHLVSKGMEEMDHLSNEAQAAQQTQRKEGNTTQRLEHDATVTQPMVNEAAPPVPEKETKREKKKQKGNPAELKMRELIGKIHACAKAADFSGAMQLFEEVQREGIALPLHLYNTLLYVALGSDSWEALARGGDPTAHAVANIQTALQATNKSSQQAGVCSAAEKQRSGPEPQPDGGVEVSHPSAARPAAGPLPAATGQASTTAEPPAKRKRGRPRKVQPATALPAASADSSEGSASGSESHTATSPPPQEEQLTNLATATLQGVHAQDPSPQPVQQPEQPQQQAPAAAGAPAAAAGAVSGQPLQGGALSAMSPASSQGAPPPLTPISTDASSAALAGEPPQPAAQPELSLRQQHVAAAQQVWAGLQAAGLQADAGTFLALARLEGLQGRADEALRWVHACQAAGQPLHIRNLHPAMVAICMARDAPAALRLDAFLAAQASESLDLTEYEFMRLFEALAADATTAWAQLRDVLLRMGRELQELQPSSLALLRAYFTSPQSQAALAAPTPPQPPHLSPPSSPTHPPTTPQTQGGPESPPPAAAVPQAAASPSRLQLGPPSSPGHHTTQPLPPRMETAAQTLHASAPASVQGRAAGSWGASGGQQGTAASHPVAAGVAADRAPAAEQQAGQGAAVAWQVDDVQVCVALVLAVDAAGYCPEAGERLRVVDLENSEWESFARGVASLAQRNEANAGNFNHYMEWYHRNGPYEILLDGANIAFFGGGNQPVFRWGQVMRLWDVVAQRHPGKRMLLMLHRKHMNGPDARAPAVEAFLDRLQQQKAFYYTPHGSNDDWYWMYAAVRARHQGLLVSNDELRDHIFSLLRPKHFLKWKAHHIVHYTFTPFQHIPPQLIYPPAYTSCVQQLRNGTWMFPCAGGGDRWLCARPVGLPAPQPSAATNPPGSGS